MKTRRSFTPHPDKLTVGLCPNCGKATYRTRREAKRAARGMFPGTHHRPFQCGQRWHIQLLRGESR
ncbi:hypothetical protein [Streptomyces sp. NPDC002328]|uniref:hypothetical protein n=1 Tax=Streptomyces sp. NPDC002328 TaxID=3364642 RepID=UPI0036B6E707